MEKLNWKKIVLIVIVGLIFITYSQVYTLKKQVRELNQMVGNLRNDLGQQISNMETSLYNSYRNMEESLAKQASIFSKTSVEITLHNKQMQVTMEGVPKELKTGEKMYAQVTTKGKTYEQETSAQGVATLLVDYTDVIQPVFVIKSSSGTRQEALPEQMTVDFLTGSVYTQWEEKGNDVLPKLQLWVSQVSQSVGNMPFTKEDIKEAHFILVPGKVDSYEMQGSVPVPEAPGVPVNGETGYINGITVPAVELPQGSLPTQHSGESYLVGYAVDLSSYQEAQEQRYYDVYFALTTKDGMTYQTPYGVASFFMGKGSRDLSSGDGMLQPIFS